MDTYVKRKNLIKHLHTLYEKKKRYTLIWERNYRHACTLLVKDFSTLTIVYENNTVYILCWIRTLTKKDKITQGRILYRYTSLELKVYYFLAEQKGISCRGQCFIIIKYRLQLGMY